MKLREDIRVVRFGEERSCGDRIKHLRRLKSFPIILMFDFSAFNEL
jgi:hypothetical protein